MRTIVAFLALILVSSAGFARGSSDLGPKPPGNFDYYILSLTWVPAFCAVKNDPNECGRNLGFALHGLWPEYTNGDYPSHCTKAELTPATRTQFEGIFASPTMIDHEWTTHGTCSGLAPADYFNLAKADHEAVTIPAAYQAETSLKDTDSGALQKAFMAANPSLAADDFIIVTGSGRITEVRFCVTKDNAAFRSCKAQ